MKIHQIRNATLVLELGEHRILVDPVLGDANSLPAFKMFGTGRHRNPLVPLPACTTGLLDSITAVLMTHAHHLDHFDKAGSKWVRERGLSVWSSGLDAELLRAKGLDAQLVVDGFLGMRAEVIPTKHGRGPMGWLMGPVTGFYLAHPGEPSLLLTSDAVLTDDLLADVSRLQPDVLVAPAGAANFGLGPDILFSLDELMTLAKQAPGELIFNHLEALDHCPTTRAELRQRLEREGLADRAHVPEDGESLSFDTKCGGQAQPSFEIKARPVLRPGFQKWVVNQVAKLMT